MIASINGLFKMKGKDKQRKGKKRKSINITMDVGWNHELNAADEPRNRKSVNSLNLCVELVDFSDSTGDQQDKRESINSINWDQEDMSELSTVEGESEDELSEGIAQTENTVVIRLRLVVLLALFLAAIAVSFAVYSITKNSETEEYLAAFDGLASKIISSYEGIVETKLSAISSMAVTAASLVRSHSASGMRWPFVTLNDFQVRAASVRELSNSLLVRICPVVTDEERYAYEKYSIRHLDWLEEAQTDFHGFRRSLKEVRNESKDDEALYYLTPYDDNRELDFSSGISNRIYYFDEQGSGVVQQDTGPYFPLWQESPHVGLELTNFDMKYNPDYAPYILKTHKTGQMTMGGIDTAKPGNYTDPELSTSFFALLLSREAGEPVAYQGDPMSTVFLPMFDSYDENRTVVAIATATFRWATFFEGLLPSSSPGIVVVLENTCDGPFTYEVVGEGVEYVGPGDLHDERFDDMEQYVSFKNAQPSSSLGIGLNQDICSYSLRVYPTQELHDEYSTGVPCLITSAVLLVFVFTAGMFLLYNNWVEKRQELVMNQAVSSTKIVSSLFPANVRHRLIEAKTPSEKSRLKSFLNNTEDDDSNDKPIADLFPETTVFFADIAGFTAWSSTRDPPKVFVLLQTIYQAFDDIAKKRQVFKVETIGDSYVAVAGLPSPDELHFLTMSKFSIDCVAKFNDLVQSLEEKLGPDTCDLGLRVGLHSGPVTAGVLRGERSRFQLFGDTVNTASRMESSGTPNKVQVSKATADLLIGANFGHWLSRREDTVVAKGIGMVETYWLEPKKDPSKRRMRDSVTQYSDYLTAFTRGESIESIESLGSMSATTDLGKQSRLVNWIVDILLEHIQKIVIRHEVSGMKHDSPEELLYKMPEGKTCMDEVVEMMKLPKFDAKYSTISAENHDAKINPIVVGQLRDVVTTIADCYRENSFHNFEHACHVCMHVHKLLARIVSPDIGDDSKDMNAKNAKKVAHDYTHGINSDPLTLLAIVFAALIHDVDHHGVSNVQLAKEDQAMAEMYRNKSIAEQNSLDLAWDVLMKDEYKDLRATIFGTRKELLRFRQVLVNVVLATDIFDKELNNLRKSRWNRAFGVGSDEGGERSNNKDDDNNLRATIVIEHIIQASDVSHTMQHWHIYRKWNQRLFFEMYEAYQDGRCATNPADSWYDNEIKFFDNYVIPLAKKLKDCNVFGASSDECLTFATQNRSEWEKRGHEVVASLIEKVEDVSYDPGKSVSNLMIFNDLASSRSLKFPRARAA